MSRHPHPRPPARLLRSIFLWHRYLGLLAAVFVVLLAVTGVLLNHTEALRLDQRQVHAPWLLRWYGIPQPVLVTARAGRHRLLSDGEALQLDDHPVSLPRPGRLTAALALDDLLLVGREHDLLLLTPEGELADRLPLPVRALARDEEERIWVLGDQGPLRLDEALTEAAPDTPRGNLAWQRARTLRAGEAPELRRSWQGPGLPLERVLLDLHSGRFFGGRLGVWLMDAAALMMLFLALSGSWIWLDRKRKQRTHRRRKKRGRPSVSRLSADRDE